MYFLRDLVSVSSAPEAPGTFISPVDICQPCGILGLNLDGISRAEAQDRVNLIIPLGKFFSMSKFENHLAKKWPLSLQRPNLHLRMSALSPLLR